MEDIGRNIFDEDEIIREYAPHPRRPPTTEGPPLLEGIDAEEYYVLNSHIYEKSNALKPCNENQFECGNKVCIPLFLRCDGFYACNDLSDEFDCDQYNSEKRRTTTARPANLVRPTQATGGGLLPWWRTTAAPTVSTTAWAMTTTGRPTTSATFAQSNETLLIPSRLPKYLLGGGLRCRDFENDRNLERNVCNSPRLSIHKVA